MRHEKNDHPKPLRSVFISTYTFIKDGIRTNNSGPVNPMVRFFGSLKNVPLTVMEQPLPSCDFGEIVLRRFENGEELMNRRVSVPFSPRKMKSLKNDVTYLRLKMRDLLSNFMIMPKFGNPKTLFIGLECINAACGAFLKKLGCCGETVYYIFDWAPDRYENHGMNKVYMGLDKFSSYQCDYTWNITYTIGEARVHRLGYDPQRISPQLYVPYCCDYHEENILPDDEIDPFLLLYSGGLIRENGPDLLIEAFSHVSAGCPEARLLVIGGGNDEERLREEIKARHLEHKITITGFIKEEKEVMRLQKRAGVAVAPYPFMKGSRKPYGDVIKIRMYFASGLPVISTPVPPVSREIREEGLGTVTEDDAPLSLAGAILGYLGNRERISETRKRVIQKARTGSWRDTYTKALKEMNYMIRDEDFTA